MGQNKEGGKKIVKREGKELVPADSDIIRRGLEAIQERSESLPAERIIQIVCIGVDKLVQSAYYPAILESQSVRILGESNHKQAAVDVYKSTNPDVVVIFRNADRQERSHGSVSSVAGKPWELTAHDQIDQEDKLEDWLISTRMIKRFDRHCRIVVVLGPTDLSSDDFRARAAISAGALSVRSTSRAADILDDVGILAGFKNGLKAIDFPDDRSIGFLYSREDIGKSLRLEGPPPSVLGEAKGTFRLPIREQISLDVRDSSDLSFLASLKPDSLYSLRLNGAVLSNSDLEHLTNLTELIHLDLSNTSIDDGDLARIASLSNLDTLNLAGTSISNSGMKYLLELSYLWALSLIDTNVTADGLAILQRLPAFSLYISAAQIRRAEVEDYIQRRNKTSDVGEWLFDESDGAYHIWNPDSL